MKDCFVCTTPYQVLAVLSLIKEFKKTGDLYITSQASGARTLAERIRREGLFDEVIYVDEDSLYRRYNFTGNSIVRRLNIIRSYKNTDAIVRSFIRNEREYENVFVSSNFLTGRLMMFYLYKHYGISSYSLYDDGIGSYCDKRLWEARLRDRICQDIFVHKGVSKINFSDRYLYRDDLYLRMNPKKENERIHKLNFLNKENDELMSRLFGLSHTFKIYEKAIIMDSLREVDLTDNGMIQIEGLFNLVTEVLGSDQVVLKKHPRDRTERTNSRYLALSGDINLPFEAYAFYQDFSDKILITNISTAVFSPKMILDQEPTIILLFKILKSEIRYPFMIDKLVPHFKDLYRDPSKIYVPETKEELVDIIQRLKLGRNVVPA